MNFSNAPQSPTLFSSFFGNQIADSQALLQSSLVALQTQTQSQLAQVLEYIPHAQQTLVDSEDTADSSTNIDDENLKLTYCVYLHRQKDIILQLIPTISSIVTFIQNTTDKNELKPYFNKIQAIQSKLPSNIHTAQSFTQAHANQFLDDVTKYLALLPDPRALQPIQSLQTQPQTPIVSSNTPHPFPTLDLTFPPNDDDVDWFTLSDSMEGLISTKSINGFFSKHWKKLVPLLLIASFASTSTTLLDTELDIELAEFSHSNASLQHQHQHQHQQGSTQQHSLIHPTIQHMTPSFAQVQFNNQFLRAFSPGLAPNTTTEALLSPSVLNLISNSISIYNTVLSPRLSKQTPSSNTSAFNNDSSTIVPLTPTLAQNQHQREQPTPFFSPNVVESTPSTPKLAPHQPLFTPLTPVGFSTPPTTALPFYPKETVKKTVMKTHQTSAVPETLFTLDLWDNADASIHSDGHSFPLQSTQTTTTITPPVEFSLTDLEQSCPKKLDLYCHHHISHPNEPSPIISPIDTTHSATDSVTLQTHSATNTVTLQETKKRHQPTNKKQKKDTVTDTNGVAAATALGAIIAAGIIADGIENKPTTRGRKKKALTTPNSSISSKEKESILNSMENNVAEMNQRLNSLQHQADALTASIGSNSTPPALTPAAQITTTTRMTRSRAATNRISIPIVTQVSPAPADDVITPVVTRRSARIPSSTSKRVSLQPSPQKSKLISSLIVSKPRRGNSTRIAIQTELEATSQVSSPTPSASSVSSIASATTSRYPTRRAVQRGQAILHE